MNAIFTDDPSSGTRNRLLQSGSQGLSSRYRKLDRLEAFYVGQEYDHLPLDWSGFAADSTESISPNAIQAASNMMLDQGQNQTPVRRRRPTAPLRLCPLVVDRFTGLLFSEERIPEVTVEGDPDAEDFLRAVIERSHFWSRAYLARTFGGSQGSTLVTVKLEDGTFNFEIHNPKTVQDMVWRNSARTVLEGVLIQYVTIKEYEELDEKSGRPTGRYKEVPYLYRRIIDTEWDVVFKETPLEGGRIPIPEVDLERSFHHRRGYFPGVWVQNLPDQFAIDGSPDCTGAYQLFDTIDRLYAQANRALLANMDPTMWLSMDKKEVARLGGQIKTGSENILNVGLGGTAGFLEITAGGITAGLDFAKQLKTAAMDRVQCVLVDPTEISGAAQSAKAIEYIYGPMLEKAGRLRSQYGEALKELFEIVLRMAREYREPDEYEGNAKPFFRLPDRIEELDPDPNDPNSTPVVQYHKRNPGTGGLVSIKWGPFFSPTPMDIQTESQTVAAAQQQRLIDQETAIKLVAPLFGIKDTKALIRKIKEEDAAKTSLYPTDDFGGMPDETMPEEGIEQPNAGTAPEKPEEPT